MILATNKVIIKGEILCGRVLQMNEKHFPVTGHGGEIFP